MQELWAYTLGVPISLKAKTVPPTRIPVSIINAATRFMTPSYAGVLLTYQQFSPAQCE